MHNRNVMVENTRVLLLIRKILCLSALNNDNTVVHIRTFILGTIAEPILSFIKTTKIIVITNNRSERALFANLKPYLMSMQRHDIDVMQLHVLFVLFVLRFYGPVNPMGSCRARSVYLTTRLLGRLSPLSG